MIRAVLLDIEGTISPISFVKEVLFPYSKERIETFIKENKDNPDIKKILQEIEKIEGKKLSEEEIVQILKNWIDEDKKITPLKDIQGYIWKEGFESGVIKAPLYEDAYKKMFEWKRKGIPLYIYSSGSVQAQKLFFSHTDRGNILNLFSSHFDTKIGSKKDPESYIRISKEIGISPEEILFLSDNPEEVMAASEAGMKAIRVVREKDAEYIENFPYPQISSFDEIKEV